MQVGHALPAPTPRPAWQARSETRLRLLVQHQPLGDDDPVREVGGNEQPGHGPHQVSGEERVPRVARPVRLQTDGQAVLVLELHHALREPNRLGRRPRVAAAHRVDELRRAAVGGALQRGCNAIAQRRKVLVGAAPGQGDVHAGWRAGAHLHARHGVREGACAT